jgi:hypothetical protein
VNPFISGLLRRAVGVAAERPMAVARPVIAVPADEGLDLAPEAAAAVGELDAVPVDESPARPVDKLDATSAPTLTTNPAAVLGPSTLARSPMPSALPAAASTAVGAQAKAAPAVAPLAAHEPAGTASPVPQPTSALLSSYASSLEAPVPVSLGVRQEQSTVEASEPLGISKALAGTKVGRLTPNAPTVDPPTVLSQAPALASEPPFVSEPAFVSVSASPAPPSDLAFARRHAEAPMRQADAPAASDIAVKPVRMESVELALSDPQGSAEQEPPAQLKARAPNAAAAAQGPAPERRRLEIHIGSIEVRVPARAQPAEPARVESATPLVANDEGFSDYLARRSYASWNDW